MPSSGVLESRHNSSMQPSPSELPFLDSYFNQYHYLPECYVIKNNTQNCPTSRAQQGRWDCTKVSWFTRKTVSEVKLKTMELSGLNSPTPVGLWEKTEEESEGSLLGYHLSMVWGIQVCMEGRDWKGGDCLLWTAYQKNFPKIRKPRDEETPKMLSHLAHWLVRLSYIHPDCNVCVQPIMHESPMNGWIWKVPRGKLVTVHGYQAGWLPLVERTVEI